MTLLGVGFLNQGTPEFIPFGGVNKHELSIFDR